jgi:hypothetical protein
MIRSAQEGLTSNLPFWTCLPVDSPVNVIYLFLGVFKVIGEATDRFISREKEMLFMRDGISKKILNILKKSKEPLETKEIENMIPSATRIMILNRLKDLRGEGKIKGKRVGAGTKGVWIWWEF